MFKIWLCDLYAISKCTDLDTWIYIRGVNLFSHKYDNWFLL